MNTIRIALSCLLASAAVSAFASPLVLDFEDVPAAATLVDNRYAALGVTFSNMAFSAGSKVAVAGGVGAFYGTKKSADPLSNKGAVILTADPSSPPSGSASSFFINLTGGFNAVTIDFAGVGPATLTALDKNGDALGSDTETALALCNNRTFACNWSTLSLDLGSVEAFSLEVSGVDGQQWFDHMVFSSVSTTPPGLPEPGSVALSLAALGALAWTRKRVTTGKRA